MPLRSCLILSLCFSEHIKQLTVTEDNSDMSSSAHEGLDDVTVIENQRNQEKMTELPDEITEDVDAATVTDAGNMKPGSVSESLEVVNKLLEDIDQDLKIHLNNDNQDEDQKPMKNQSFDSIKEEKSRKSITFRFVLHHYSIQIMLLCIPVVNFV